MKWGHMGYSGLLKSRVTVVTVLIDMFLISSVAAIVQCCWQSWLKTATGVNCVGNGKRSFIGLKLHERLRFEFTS